MGTHASNFTAAIRPVVHSLCACFGPSLAEDSHFSYAYLVNAATSGWRPVPMVEVMCPYFSSSALRKALGTFNLSYSTWGLDVIWPRLFDFDPVAVDKFTIRHTKPVGSKGAFYRYMKSIGVSPEREVAKLRTITDDELRRLLK